MNNKMDPYSRKARIEGYRARSIYKLKSLNKKYRLIKEKDRVLDIGCYPGSWLEACKQFNAGLIIGIDIKPLNPLKGVIFINDDINNKNIVGKIKKINNEFDAVISDVAPKTSGILDQERSLDLSIVAYKITKCVLKPGGNFLCKVFQGKGSDDFVNNIKKEFGFVKITKPIASKKRSYEVYIVAKYFKQKN